FGPRLQKPRPRNQPRPSSRAEVSAGGFANRDFAFSFATPASLRGAAWADRAFGSELSARAPDGPLRSSVEASGSMWYSLPRRKRRAASDTRWHDSSSDHRRLAFPFREGRSAFATLLGAASWTY